MSSATYRCNVAIAGFGGVGKAVAELLHIRQARYRELYGADVRLVAVCRSGSGLLDSEGLDPGLPPLQAGLTGRDFLNAAPVDILIEAGPSNFRTGGPALGYMRDALSRGRHVIAISKGALVFDSRSLRQLAARSGAQLRVSGATAAALPTIDLLQYNLLGSTVQSIEGILNGTTNYLLTQMIDHGHSFAHALQAAQRDGIAEPDPSFDVDGWDTACKMIIIANFGLGADLSLDDLTVGGIAQITQDQLASWRQQGLTPKLIGHLARTGDSWRGGVELRTFTASQALSLVSGKNKAIRIATSEMGEIFVAGGASGTGATAAAALKDLEHILAARSGAAIKPIR